MRREILLLEITIASKSGGAELGDQAHSLEKMIDARMRRTPGSGWRRSNAPHQVALFQLSGGTTDVPKIIPRFK